MHCPSVVPVRISGRALIVSDNHTRHSTHTEKNYLPTRRDIKRFQGSRADGDEGSSSVQYVCQEGHEESGNPLGRPALLCR